MSKVSTKPVSGTRDFSPLVVRRRQFIFSTLREVFERFGFEPIETPAMERLEVLTGKYGDEGDQLIFKILNSGDYLKDAPADALQAADSRRLLPHIADKALRYDLTVPFARYVVNYRNDIVLPFKRYQMQPVWRADRPQAGRYREFWQCDVDVVGSPALVYDAEFVQIYDQALSRLGLRDFTIHLNHRKLLQAVAEAAGAPERFTDICVAVDKLDKIGYEGVESELRKVGLSDTSILTIQNILRHKDHFLVLGGKHQIASIETLLLEIEKELYPSKSCKPALEDFRTLLKYLSVVEFSEGCNIKLDITLARGLNYYTGLIFEVKAANNRGIGSIGGGGRYDDLTGMFGWEGVPGIGISFGADRIYDVLEDQNLFTDIAATRTQVLVANFGGKALLHALGVLSRLRAAGIPAEIYPDQAKMAKQFGYADKKGIPFVLIIGSEEAATGLYGLKDMASGVQENLSEAGVLQRLNTVVAA